MNLTCTSHDSDIRGSDGTETTFYENFIPLLSFSLFFLQQMRRLHYDQVSTVSRKLKPPVANEKPWRQFYWLTNMGLGLAVAKIMLTFEDSGPLCRVKYIQLLLWKCGRYFQFRLVSCDNLGIYADNRHMNESMRRNINAERINKQVWVQ